MPNIAVWRKHALDIFNASLAAVDPYRLIHDRVIHRDNQLIIPAHPEVDLKKYHHIYLLGMGKGCAPMARAMEEILGERLTGGHIIVKYGYTDRLVKIIQHEAGHPLPDDNTLQATQKLLDYAGCFSADDLIFVLISGGGSALLEWLPDGISLGDLLQLNRLLLRSTATIHEINCVRKHISMVKGGQLLRAVPLSRCITLILSDVVGDDISVIASGPTAPDASTYSEAIHILQKYRILPEVPASVIVHLQKGRLVQIAETPKPGDGIFDRVQNILIGNNTLALSAAKKKADEVGLNTIVLAAEIRDSVEEVAGMIAGIIREIQENNGIPLAKPACVLLGGEPVVKVRGEGKGGRNQQLALQVAHLLGENRKRYLFMSCGTDGTDGPTDAAGAVVTAETLSQAREMGLDAREFLDKNDAFHFFDSLNSLIRTGPTRTNVMDIMIVIVP
jgi:glycerate 2-kinase